ncbi:MAG: 30S ribosome-binding factor RbfA [Desulfocapsaceae bacterium]|jgi:ribosome-binding factor A|nr:30S ribosome-binding factor RbfA [Desulfocapsaceae bacterium]
MIITAEWHPKQELESFGIGRKQGPKRSARVADVIKNELSVLIIQRVRDPRLRDISISRVELSDDLRHAKIYYTSLHGSSDSEAVKKRLVKAGGFMRSHLAKVLNLRFTPELHFWYDETVEKVEEMERLLAEIARKRNERENNT